MSNAVDQNTLPKIIDLEPTINCNYGCVMCQRTYWSRKAPDMNFDQFRYIYDAFPILDHIKLQGIGEPFLNADLFKMIKYAKQRGSHVTTYTNGSLLHMHDNAIRIVDSGIDLIRISVDGGKKETFERIRRRSNFNQVIKNIALVCDARKGKSSPCIELWMIGCPENIAEIPEVVDIAKSVDISTVYIQLLLNPFSYKNEIQNKLETMRLKSDALTNSILNQAVEYASTKNINLRLFASKIYSPEKPCNRPFESLFVSVEGYVVPCGTISDPNTVNMGNIFEQDITDIWKSEKYRAFRQSLLRSNLAIACQSCYCDQNKDLTSNLLAPWLCSIYPFSDK